MEWSFSILFDSWVPRAWFCSGLGLAFLVGSPIAGCAQQADLDDPFADYGAVAALEAGSLYVDPPRPNSSGDDARDSMPSEDATGRMDARAVTREDEDAVPNEENSDACVIDASAPPDAADAARGDAARDEASDGPDEPPAVDVTLDESDAAPPPLASTALPGDLLITEIMFAPWGPEPQSEWFEIYNTSTDPKLLSGLTLQDGYPRTHVIAADPPVVIPSQTYVVLVRDRAVAEANVVPDDSIAYEYGAGLAPGEGIQLENDASGALSLWNGDALLANVPYGPWGLASYGQSIELDALQFAGGDDATSWCIAENPWAAGSDDGTPGGDNDCP